MQSFRRTLGSAAVLGLTAVATMAAQDMPKHEGMPGMMPDRMQQEMQAMKAEMEGMMSEMMGVHAYAPDALLDRKADLVLTAEQVRTLGSLAAEVKVAKAHAKAEHDLRHAQVVEQFKLAKPDAAKVKADGQAAMQEMATTHGIELSAFAQAKGLLTDAQRAKVDGWVAEHEKMMKNESGHAEHH